MPEYADGHRICFRTVQMALILARKVTVTPGWGPGGGGGRGGGGHGTWPNWPEEPVWLPVGGGLWFAIPDYFGCEEPEANVIRHRGGGGGAPPTPRGGGLSYGRWRPRRGVPNQQGLHSPYIPDPKSAMIATAFTYSPWCTPARVPASCFMQTTLGRYAAVDHAGNPGQESSGNLPSRFGLWNRMFHAQRAGKPFYSCLPSRATDKHFSGPDGKPTGPRFAMGWKRVVIRSTKGLPQEPTATGPDYSPRMPMAVWNSLE